MAQTDTQVALSKMPLGLSDWSDIRDKNKFFVDKTALLSDLVTCYDRVFISRPRRMGKTLLVSMLAELFANGIQKFSNTAVGDSTIPEIKWPETRTYPVIRISFLDTTYSNNKEISFEKWLKGKLIDSYIKAGFSQAKTIDQNQILSNFLFELRRITDTNSKVVILIDEWDHPLSSHLDQPYLFDSIQATLRTFYSWLREYTNIRFLLITGIMRYNSTALFTGQDIQDISMDPDWADLMGVTHEELLHCYAPYISKAAQRLKISEQQLLEKIKDYYDGFCFDNEARITLYNPFALNLFFSPVTNFNSRRKLKFDSYWMNSSDAATALLSFLHSIKFKLPEDLDMLISLQHNDTAIPESFFNQPLSYTQVKLLPILAQAGYLTIKEVIAPPTLGQTELYLPTEVHSYLSAHLNDQLSMELRDEINTAAEDGAANEAAQTYNADDAADNDDTAETWFRCGMPNRDVSLKFISVVKRFLNHTLNHRPDDQQLKLELRQHLEATNIEGACNCLNELLNGILFDAFQDAHEAFYRTVFAFWLKEIFSDVREETPNAHGRSDIELTTSQQEVIVFELKLINDRNQSPRHYEHDSTFAAIKDQVLEPAKLQIFSKGYGVNWHNTGKRVSGVILVLSAQERRIVAWRAYPHNQSCQEGIVPSVHMHNKYLAPAAN